MNQEKNSNEKGAYDSNRIYRNTKLDLVKSIEARPHSSGFKSFLNWFRRVEKLEIEQNAPEEDSDSSSVVSSTSSTATAASFAFLEPQVYKPYGDALQAQTFIAPGPYTDTYRRLMDERERRRKLDKDITLRKKYHLYSSGSTLNGTLRSTKGIDHLIPKENATNTSATYDTFSLPAMNKKNITNVEFRNKGHRRAASETKFTRPNSYVHVKGKRKAPLPPDQIERRFSTYRKKRLAPTPPNAKVDIQTEPQTSLNSVKESQPKPKENMEREPIKYADQATPWPEAYPNTIIENSSPRFWFKRQHSDIKLKNKKSQSENNKTKAKHDFPEMSFFRNSKKHFGKSVNNGNENRMSAVHNLPNISELDREANEIIQMKRQLIEENNNDQSEMPVFTNPNSARELISKFNAMNNAKAVRSTVVAGCSSNNEIVMSNSQEPSRSGAIGAKLKFTTKSESLVNNSATSLSVNMQEGITWNCTQCTFTNVDKQNQDNCYKCNSKKESATDNLLLNSFQEEVFDALSHLGNMPNDKGNLNNKNNVSSDNKNKEQQKLRELLKEMKNSLPKRPKSISSNVKSILTEHVKETSKAAANMTEDPVFIISNAVSVPVLTNKDKLLKEESSEFNSKIIELDNDQHPKADNNSPKAPSSKQSQDINKLTNAVTKSEASGHNLNGINNFHFPKLIDLNNIYANIKSAQPRLSVNKVTESSSQTNNKADNDPKLLLKQLEKAIVSGNDFVAATIARQLALLKVSCTVQGSMQSTSEQKDLKSIDVYVEDQDSHHGPITIKVRSNITIGELKNNVQHELDIPIHIQKWIIGKQLAVDDEQRVDVYNNGDFTNPLFLYLVNAEMGQKNQFKAKNITLNNITTNCAPVNRSKMDIEQVIPVIDAAKTIISQSSSFTKNVSVSSSLENQEIPLAVAKPPDIIQEKKVTPSTSHYNELINLDSRHLIRNCEAFECPICFCECQQNAGVILRECLHTFCKECLENTIKFCSEAEVKCPYRDYTYSCESVIQEREIKALVSKDLYEQHLAKSVAVAENSMLKTFHCKTADCKGWCIFEDNVNQFRCPVCKHANCLTCQAIHEDENCKQYQDRMKNDESCENLDGLRTEQMLEEMVNRGDALICPSCQVVLMKKWGCDWVRCSMCKTEICWVTRGPRWGPAGKGDVTAGCQCGVNGIKCHPKCNYCH